MRAFLCIVVAASANMVFVGSTPAYSQASTEVLQDAPLTGCDTYAASPDPKRKAAGIPFDKIDPALAIPACESAIRQYPTSNRLIFQLGRAYNKKGDYRSALTFYQKAADRGYAPAQHNLAVMYERAQGVKKDDARAVTLYRKAAEQGFVFAQFNLGNMYANGWGVPRDYVEAFKWLRKAAQQGFAAAQFNVGNMYRTGQGVPRDFAEALAWLRKAAEQSNTRACVVLGLMYADGQGVAKDYAEAVKWFRVAAGQGDAEGQRLLGLMYAHGSGVSRNLAEAAGWYRKAAAQDDTEAQSKLAALEADLAAGRAAEKAGDTALQTALASGKAAEQAWQEAAIAAGRAAREAELAAGRPIEIAKRAAQQAEEQVRARAPKTQEHAAVPQLDSADARKQTTGPNPLAGANPSPNHDTDDFEHDWKILNEDGKRFVAVGALKYNISGWSSSLDITLRDLSSVTASVIINSSCNHPTNLRLQWSLRVYLVDGTLAGQCKLVTVIEGGIAEFQKKLGEEPWRLGLLRAMGINPYKGPMPRLSPAEENCKETIDRAGTQPKPDQAAFQHELDRCVENLRQEWLRKHSTDVNTSGTLQDKQTTRTPGAGQGKAGHEWMRSAPAFCQSERYGSLTPMQNAACAEAAFRYLSKNWKTITAANGQAYEIALDTLHRNLPSNVDAGATLRAASVVVYIKEGEIFNPTNVVHFYFDCHDRFQTFQRHWSPVAYAPPLSVAARIASIACVEAHEIPPPAVAGAPVQQRDYVPYDAKRSVWDAASEMFPQYSERCETPQKTPKLSPEVVLRAQIVMINALSNRDWQLMYNYGPPHEEVSVDDWCRLVYRNINLLALQWHPQ